LILLWLAKKGIHKSMDIRFSAILLFLLLLQRPYVFSMYWGIIIWVLIAIIYFEGLKSQQLRISTKKDLAIRALVINENNLINQVF